jgi:tyrosinase
VQQPENRRRFISTALTFGAGIATACKTAGGDLLQQQGNGAPDPANVAARTVVGTPRERVSVYAPEAAAMLTLYEKAIKAMQALPATNKLSWAAQAKVHEDSCPHGNWFFLPWHRFYLFYFEEACRKVLADARDPAAESFALPYWDWSKDQTLPAAFRKSGSVLRNSTRGNNAQPSRGNPKKIGSEFVGTATIDRLLKTDNFYTFASGPARTQRGRGTTGVLEGTPHNRVHVYVDGDMATFLSPKDPIFWLHHCNVDRLWALWVEKNPTKALPENVTGFTANDWLDASMSGFFDRSGTAVTRKVKDATDLANFGYTYKSAVPSRGMLASAAIAPALFDARSREAALPPPQVFKGVAAANSIEDQHRLTLTVILSRPVVDLLKNFRSNPRGRFLFKAAGIPIPSAAARRETFLRFFINEKNLARSSDNSPNYVGSYAWFHHDHAGHAGHDEANPTITVEYDITATVMRLVAAGEVREGQKVALQAVKLDFDGNPRPFENPAALGSLELTLEYQPT